MEYLDVTEKWRKHKYDLIKIKSMELSCNYHVHVDKIIKKKKKISRLFITDLAI